MLPDHHRRLAAAARAAGVPGLDPARGRAAAAHRPGRSALPLTRRRTPRPLTVDRIVPEMRDLERAQDGTEVKAVELET